MAGLALSGTVLKSTTKLDFFSMFADGVRGCCFTATCPSPAYVWTQGAGTDITPSADACGAGEPSNESSKPKVRSIDFLRIAARLTVCDDWLMPDEKLSARIQENYLRARREQPKSAIANTKGPEPTLDEARADLAKAIGKLADQFLSKRYGPLVGTIAETTTNATLQQFEMNLTKAKGDITLVVQEFSDRIFSTGKLRRE